VRRWYQLTFPDEVTAEAVLLFTRSLTVRKRSGLLGTADTVALELLATKQAITWRLGLMQREEPQVLGALRHALPAIRLKPLSVRQISATAAWELRTSTHLRPLAVTAPEQVAAALLVSLQDLVTGEEVVLSWLVGPWLPRPPVRPVQKSRDAGLLDVGDLSLDSEQTRALRDKQKEPLFGVVGRIAVTGRNPARQVQLRQRVLGALQLTRASGVGLERRFLPTACAVRRLKTLQQPLIGWPCVLSASELVAVLGWPIGTPNLPNITYGGGRVLPPVAGTYGQRSLRTTGEASFPGRETPVGLLVRDALMHMVVTGPTGTGKSTLLASLALQDAAAGRSVIVIDPSVKADLVRDIAERLPADRLDETIILDARSARPVGFNPLIGEPTLVADTVLHIFSELFSSSFGPRTADVLLNSLQTLAHAGEYSLVELMPLLQNPAFRAQVLARFGRSDHLGVGPFWSRFEALSEAERLQIVGPSQNKLQAFTARPAVRAIIGQNPGFDLSEVFFKRRILLVSLAPGEVGSTAATLLGSLLMGSLWGAAQRRSRLPLERRFPILIYLDEFQSLLRLPQDLGDALAQARGLGIGFVLAHQARSQLSPGIRSAVDANARSKIVFQSGHEDGVAIARLLGGGLDASDLQALDVYETYQALTVGGRTTPPMSVRTLPLPDALYSYDEVKQLSEERYGLERAAVDELLLQRREVASSDGPIGARRRGGTS